MEQYNKIVQETDEKTPEESNKDKTFNKLKELQTLLKKESALKELCMKLFLIKFKYKFKI